MKGYSKPPLVPESLFEEYANNGFVQDVFTASDIRNLSREEALVWCIKGLIKSNDLLLKDASMLSHVKSVIRTWDETGYALKLSILKEMLND
jgi:hypothetical protein